MPNPYGDGDVQVVVVQGLIWALQVGWAFTSVILAEMWALYQSLGPISSNFFFSLVFVCFFTFNKSLPTFDRDLSWSVFPIKVTR